eukprot:m.148006 g.148006  ORF g.148006 m.148006 type:complete len:53 (-) comp30572_c1_seq4:193-351(-)
MKGLSVLFRLFPFILRSTKRCTALHMSFVFVFVFVQVFVFVKTVFVFVKVAL